MAKLPRIWDVPSYSGKHVTVTRLGFLPRPEDRWGWIWFQWSEVDQPVFQDPFGRLHVRADARLFWWGGGEKPTREFPTDTVFVRWTYPAGQGDDSRVLELYVPGRAIPYIGKLSEEPYGTFAVKGLIQKYADIPQEMRPE